MKSDQIILTTFYILGGAFILFAYSLRVRHGKEIQRRIIGIAQQHGLGEIRKRWWFGNGVRARWQGFPVDVFFRARYKSTPARIVTRVVVAGASRLIVKRKFGESWFHKPTTLIGPPLVEIDAEGLWVRADEASLAERVVRDPKTAALVESNLVDRYDEIAVTASQLEIRRALDGPHLRERMANANQFEIASVVANEELPLALAMLQIIGARAV